MEVTMKWPIAACLQCCLDDPCQKLNKTGSVQLKLRVVLYLWSMVWILSQGHGA